MASIVEQAGAESIRVKTNGIELHCACAGPADGPVVILLHGFPEFWFGWRRQIPALAAAGFRVVAPDSRGYNTSDKPARVRDYRIEELVDDVAGLIGYFSPGRRAGLVGHDWGGIVAFYVAMRRPELLAKLAVLNAPHPAAYLRELPRHGQWLRSAYAYFFQLPFLPEWLIRWNDHAVVRQLFRDGPARTSAHPAADVEAYVSALRRPRAIHSTINYYRAAFRKGFAEVRRHSSPIDAPTLLLWGDLDPYLSIHLTRDLEKWIPRLTVRHFPQATHWLQHDAPDEVNHALIDWFNS